MITVNGMTSGPVTPLFASGFELGGDYAEDGIVSITGAATAYSTTFYQKSLRERLGVAADPGRGFFCDQGVHLGGFRHALREVVLGVATRKDPNSNPDTSITFQTASGGTISRIRLTTGIIELRRTIVTLATSTTGFDHVNEFEYQFFHVFIDNNDGFARFYDASFDSAHMLVGYDGDTDHWNTAPGRLITGVSFGGPRHYLDDAVVWGRTLFVSSLTSVAAGETVTGGTSGATAAIDAVEVDADDPTKAVLWLAHVSGDFESGESLSFSGGGSATAANDHPEDIHGLIRPVFIRYRKPTTDEVSNWTRSGGSTDAEAIGEDAANDNSLYIEATAVDLVNEHKVESAPAGLYAGADFLMPQAWAEQDSGGVGSVHFTLKSDASDNGGDTRPAGGSPGRLMAAATTLDPDTEAGWTVSGADAVVLQLKSA